MAAADLSRSRGVDRTTKGLFFIFTLLCLVCFVSSLSAKDRLETSKKKYLKLKQELDELKATRLTKSAMISEIMSEYMTLFDQMIVLVKKAQKLLPDDFPLMDTFMENISAYMKKTNAQLDDSREELETIIQISEQKLSVLQEQIQFLEEQQAEL